MTAEPQSEPEAPPGAGPEDAGPAEDPGEIGPPEVDPGETGPAEAESGTSEPGDAEPAHPPHHLAHTWEEARQAAYDAATPIPSGPVALRIALGRRLDQDIVALQDMPHYASSAMDGWAVNGSGPWIPVEPGTRLAPHQASPIATGGLVPAGGKAVLRTESAVLGRDDEGLPVVMVGGKARPGEPRAGEHIRKAGEEALEGDILVKAGVELNPAHLAVAALAGYDEVQVQGKPVVRLVLTGSEVLEQGTPAPGQVRDTFGPQLPAVVAMLGGIPAGQQRIGDSYAEWLAALEDVLPEVPDAPDLPADVVITTGGTGRSGTDHLRRAVAELGGRLVIDGIAMRPGHPAVLAELPDGRFVLGLPGNPLAAMMALSTVGAPLLAALAHRDMPAVQEVPCGTTIEPDPGRTRLMPFRLLYGMGSPAQHTGPGMMRGLATADGVLVVPPHGVQLGEPVPAFALPWGLPIPPSQDGAAKAKPRSTTRTGQKGKAAPSGPVDWSALLG
ncbi:molybdopterin molybdotransferase [Pseudarthrobacter defluvii]|uniref:molybdopterin molybdotransferase MoeA n=1 Tax=Pseudarthrobacter defluvii TaxID=410837 RepID=UPI00278B2FB2|nr:molybdopterin molybdotransferase MoeA [Pseudarthrobacter defluvii]MDQ0770502.1 molybdopterin molybdotransferase [Pseudarthrobacter defluvii]